MKPEKIAALLAEIFTATERVTEVRKEFEAKSLEEQKAAIANFGNSPEGQAMDQVEVALLNLVKETGPERALDAFVHAALENSKSGYAKWLTKALIAVLIKHNLISGLKTMVEHNCNQCPVYAECDQPIKQPRKADIRRTISLKLND